MLTLCGVLFSSALFAQILWTEDFETDGNGTRYTTNIPEFYDGQMDQWGRFTQAEVTTVDLGTNGNYLWAVHDLDDDASSGTDGDGSVTWDNIVLPGTGLVTLQGLFAGSGSSSYDDTDFLEFRVTLPGEDPVSIMLWATQFGTQFNGDVHLDEDGDGMAESFEPELTTTFMPYSVQFNAGAATSMTLEMLVHSDSNFETFYVDYLQLTSGGVQSGCTDPAACNYDIYNNQDDGSCCLQNCLIMEMTDTFGDGWNGAEYTLTNQTTGETIQGGLSSGSLGVDSLCVPDGCYAITVTAGSFPSEVAWSLSGINGDLPLIGGAPLADPGLPFSVGDSGCGTCNDESACNYDPAGTNPDACLYPGCNDETACNYDPDAGCDDGSCTYPAEIYVDCDGNCLNDANENGVCDELEVNGCTDAAACNYDDLATTDDGTCCYDNCAWFHMQDTFGDGWNGAEYAVFQLPGIDTLLSGTLSTGAADSALLCLQDGCYRLEVGTGTWPAEIAYQLVLSGDTLVDGLASQTHFFSINSDNCTGCGDPTACNYNPADGESDENCEYPGCSDETACNFDPSAACLDILACEFPEEEYLDCEGNCINDSDGDGICDEVDSDGCTYALACNFNPNAVVDDGSCVFPGCIYEEAINFDPNAACDDGSCLFTGCMYLGATNYDPEATLDDGSCIFPYNLLCPTDLNDDGVTDAIDLLIFIPNYSLECISE